ncbi:MAG: hypothetical protein SVR08_00345 [Spirochaetota bacterium]|nr:hypothetical protein [Spirochaetota bacterium]
MLKNITLNRKDLYIIIFFLGFSSAIYQVLLIREILSIFRGNEFIIGILFSAWFLGIFLGARFSSNAEKKVLEKRVTISFILLPIIFVLLLLIVYFLPVIILRTVGTFYSITTELLFSIILNIPISFIFGFSFPPIVAIAAEEDRESSGGNIYFIESVGSFGGGIIFSLLIIDFLNPLAITSVLFIISNLFLIKRLNNKAYLIIMIIPIFFLLLSEKIEKKIFQYVWNNTHSGELIHYKRTRYQTIFIESNKEMFSTYGNGIYFHSLPDQYQTREIFHLIQSLRNKKSDKIMIAGSGSGSLIHNLLKTDISQLFYLEIDPYLWEMELKYIDRLYKREGVEHKLKVINRDIRHYLSTSKDKFDMIICLSPPPENAMLNRFYTTDFYSICREHLEHNGIFITAIHGFSNYMVFELKRYIASIYKSFIRQFPFHLHTSGEKIYLIGGITKNIIPKNYNDLIERYKKIYSIQDNKEIEPELLSNFNPEELMMLFEKTQLQYFQNQIGNTIDKVDENLDFKPRAYWDRTILSAMQEKSEIYNLLIKHYFLLALTIIFMILSFVDIRRRLGNRYLYRGIIIFSTGFMSISTVILMIILYQNFYGVIYYRISLINALFMLGLAAGSYLVNRVIRRVSIYSIFLMLIIIFCSIFLFIEIRIEPLFWVILFLFSLLCGTVFPILFISLSKDNFFNAASLLDSMDHFGAIAGSLLTAIFIIPLIGIIGAIFMNISLLILTITIYHYTTPRKC